MRAIALISGGLDSTLAAKLIQGLGIELIALNTLSPFCLCNRRSRNGCLHGAHSAAKALALKLVSVDVAEEFLGIVQNPKHGYGSNMNPCIDCRILLFRKAKELMDREGASFIITGEVLGQRPMSQRKDAMLLIDKESGLSGMVLRPLSAGVLEPTLPEKEGWVKRDKLLAICGRQRKEQFALAAGLGIKDFPCPSGGCLLTDPEFSRRLKDLLQHAQLTLGNIQFLKAGRYFRLGDKAVLAVGRDEKGNQRLLGLAQAGDYIFMPAGEIPGPVALGRGVFDPAQLELACRVTCRYCDLNGSPQARISSFRGEEISPEFIADYLKGQTPCCGIKLRVAPLGEAELGAFRV